MTRRSRYCALIVAAILAGLPADGVAQSKPKPATRKPAAPAPRKPTVAPADLSCPTPLGPGITSKLAYCDVLTGRDPKAGIIVRLPPHRGPLTLRFDLHNRHTYSEEQVKKKQAFASYTASIGVLTMDNTLLARAVVASEFRRAEDLVERIGGGAGPGGVKAVVPVGTESIAVQIDPGVTEVSILGEKLTVVGLDGTPATHTASGRPIATISDVTVEYTPAPAPAPARRK
jgi:hypothetical protein